jgi:hypothetical protein
LNLHYYSLEFVYNEKFLALFWILVGKTTQYPCNILLKFFSKKHKHEVSITLVSIYSWDNKIFNFWVVSKFLNQKFKIKTILADDWNLKYLKNFEIRFVKHFCVKKFQKKWMLLIKKKIILAGPVL